MPITPADLNTLATEAARALGIPGAQVSVLHRGQLTEGVTGVSSIETQLPVTPDTLFSIGSTTKVFTAALVMQLVEEGSIQLDVPVVEQLPGFALADAHALRTVTPRHLMSMSSGIDNGPYTDYGRGNDALAHYVRGLADLPHLFSPGQGYGYSNASTNVSGRLVEHVTGKTWEETLATRLVEPAGFQDTAALTEEIIYRRFAVGHELAESGEPTLVRAWALPRSMAPAGGTLCSTASDLVRFGHVFMHGGVTVDGAQVLSPQSVTAMQAREVVVPPTLMADWWGLGPSGRTWDGVDLLGHSGTTNVGSSYLLWTVERDLAIATTVNLATLGYPYAARIFKELFPTVGEIAVPASPTPPAGVTVDFARLVGRYQMSGVTMTIAEHDGALTIAADGETPWFESSPASKLIALTPTTFLPTDPAIDGRRGWALAFVGPEDAPATHLVNGVFALRRVAA